MSGIKKALITLSLGLGLAVTWPLQAREDGQWLGAEKRWLAVAFVAEAGWADPGHRKAEADHRAIFHVLKRRWQRMKRRWPSRYGQFVTVVQAYVAAMDPRTAKRGRVRWLLALAQQSPQDTVPPAGWPISRARWSRHRQWWGQALERAEGCLQGRRCRDPYLGRAYHWGGDMDLPRRCMVELPNAGTYNTFYTVSAACKRRQWARRRAQ
jgi:hypothetical protein